LSDEHPPKNATEHKRIEQAGGYVSTDGRLNGDLAVCRAFGDLVFPQRESTSTSPQGEAPRGKKQAGLTALPVVKKHYLCDEDEFLIVACDGIFEFVNYKNSVQTVRRNLRRYNEVDRANHRLVQIASAVPSLDNMTSVVVAFPKLDKDGKTVIVKPHSWQTKTNASEGKPRRRFHWKALKLALDKEEAKK
jgi:serine/threonine protein phosphatase PrpC